MPSSWKNFLFPSLTRGFALRLLAVAVSAVVLFGTILIPFRIQGHSMAPTYRDGGFNFCNTLRYVWTPPQRRDVVAVRLAGNRIMLLKRVVALEGDRVAFHDGRLVVNGETVAEPYVVDPRPWNLAPRTVARGHVYVVGDNRRVPMDAHLFGQTPRERIVGGPLW